MDCPFLRPYECCRRRADVRLRGGGRSARANAMAGTDSSVARRSSCKRQQRRCQIGLLRQDRRVSLPPVRVSNVACPQRRTVRAMSIVWISSVALAPQEPISVAVPIVEGDRRARRYGVRQYVRRLTLRGLRPPTFAGRGPPCPCRSARRRQRGGWGT